MIKYEKRIIIGLDNKEEEMLSKRIKDKLDKYHLLKHPFYKSWNDGKLTREIIKDYAEQYYQHAVSYTHLRAHET